MVPDHDDLTGSNVYTSKGAIHYLTTEEINKSKNYLENKEVELKGRDGKSSTNPITDIKTILDFFKDK